MMTEIKADRYKHFVNFNKEAYLLKTIRGASRGRCVRHAHSAVKSNTADKRSDSAGSSRNLREDVLLCGHLRAPMLYTAISLLLLARSQLNLMHFNATHPIDFLRANPPPCSLHFGVGSLCHSEADYENEPKISICSRGVEWIIVLHT